MTLQVLVGSKNPVKVGAGQRAISQWFSQHHVIATGVSVASGVPDQPMTEAETRLGAVNRVENCLAQIKRGELSSADWVMAFEGGVDHFVDGPATFAYVAISNGQKRVVGYLL